MSADKHTYKPTGPFAPQYVTGVYIPSAVLIVAAAVAKPSLLPLAVAVAAALGGWKFYSNRTCHGSLLVCQQC